MPTDLRAPADGAALGGALADGPARAALHEALRQLDVAQAYHGHARAIVLCEALTGVAQALAGLHAYGPSEQHLALALGWAQMLGGCDLLADLHCAWAEVATNAGDLAEAQGDGAGRDAARDRARGQAFEAARLARRATDPNWELRLVLRASDVLERCGDHDDAMQLQQRALQLMGMAGADAAPGDDDFASALPAGTVAQLAPGALM
jgi:hypothetical protein